MFNLIKNKIKNIFNKQKDNVKLIKTKENINKEENIIINNINEYGITSEEAIDAMELLKENVLVKPKKVIVIKLNKTLLRVIQREKKNRKLYFIMKKTNKERVRKKLAKRIIKNNILNGQDRAKKKIMYKVNIVKR